MPLWVAYSGGKDSVAVLELVRRSGVPYEAHYSITTVDPPELVQFIKSQSEVIRDQARRKDGTPITMWNAIVRHCTPPTRLVRYCCRELKESFGTGRITVTGVRWSESSRRAKGWGALNFKGKKAKKFADSIGAEYEDHSTKSQTRLHFNFSEDATAQEIFLNNDNDAIRKMTEHCVPKSRVILNPIIDWSERDVWEFIRTENLPYCELYDHGFHRLGCIGCPMNSNKKADLDRYPKYKEAYIRAFDRMLKERDRRGLKTDAWKSADEVMEWRVSK